MQPGDLIEFHGPTVPGLMYGDHVRLVAIHDGVTPFPNGHVLIGRWATVRDERGEFHWPLSEFHKLDKWCICDACTA